MTKPLVDNIQTRHNVRPIVVLFPASMSDPVNIWLATQRESIERWMSASASDANQDSAQRFWQSVAQGLSPPARELAQQLAQLGPGFLAGAGDALFELFG